MKTPSSFSGSPTPKSGRLLIVDDEVELVATLCETLSEQGYETAGFTSGDEAIGALKEHGFDLLLTDLMMPEIGGVDLLKAALEIDPNIVGVIMTGHGTVQTAVDAMKAGAFDYILKPFKLSAALPILARAMEVRRLRMENVQLKETVAIYELGKAISFTTDPNTILNKVADGAMEQCDADEVSIMLPTLKGDELYVAVMKGGDRGHILGEHVPIEKGVAGWVARNREPLVLEGEVKDPRFMPVRPRPDIRSSVSMPMLSGGKLVGVLNVSSTHLRRPFTLGQVKALSILVSTGAAALEGAWLYEEVRKSEESFRRMASRIEDVLYSVDQETLEFDYLSPSFERLLGYTPEDIHRMGGRWAFLCRVMQGGEAERQERLFNKLQAEGRLYDMPTRYEAWWRCKDGSLKCLEDHWIPEYDGGRVVRVDGVLRDITERKRMEEALREREQQLSSIYNTVADVIFHLAVERDGRYRFISVNRAFLSTTGLGYDQVVGKRVDEVIPEPSLTMVLERYGEAIRERRIVRWEETSEYPTGRLTGEVSVAPVFDEAGNCIHLVGAVHDITERRRMDEALERERGLLRTLIDSLPDHISVKDAEGRYVLVNASYARFLVLGAPEEVVGKTIFNFYPRELAEKIQADDLSIIQVGQPMINVERPGVDHAGNKMWLLGTKVPLRDRGGKVIGLVGIARDVTDSKQRERELEAIATVSSALRTATTRSDMLPVILDQLLDLLKAQASSLVMGDPGRGESVVELAHGDWASTTGLRMPPGEGLNGYVISTGKPYVNDDVHSDPRLIRPELLPGPQSVVGVPLTVHGQTIGVLWVGRSGNGESLPQPFTEQELRLFTSIVDMAANAIHRATLHEQTEKRLQRLSALRAIDMAITASLDVRVTLNVFLEQTTAQLSVDAADVLLLNPHTQTLSYAAGRGFRTNALQHTRLRLGEGHAGLAALERRIIAIPNLAEEAGDLKRAPLLADEGFIAYYAAPLIAKGHVRGVLEVFHRTPLDPDQEWLDFLEALAGQAAIAIDNAELFNNLQRSNMELILAYDTTLEGWSRALELRDLETQGHTQKVTEMTLRLARLMGFKDDQLVHIRRGALLHDIGKMGIPDSILLKAGPLTEEEREIMCRHTEYAYEMLSPIAYLRPALETPYCHHEKWDGTGYPRGLKGDSIPLPARIFAVVDVWDALRSDRPYRAGWQEEKVREHIQLLSGTHFDPQVVDVFLEMET